MPPTSFASRVIARRLRSHRLFSPAPTPTAAASAMLAVQSQDFLAGRWALGVRTAGGQTLRQVDAAFDRGELVRAWTMRGTLHILAARDLRWVLGVTAARQRQQAASRDRQLGIDDEVRVRAERMLRPALADGGMTRDEAFGALERGGIDPRGQRGVHLLAALTVEGVICQGPVVPASGARPGGIAREQRFVLVDEHIPEAGDAVPDDPLGELLVRYLAGHGPATVQDFAWWSGLTLGQAREAASRAAERIDELGDGLLSSRDAPRRSARLGAAEESVFALPAFDEYYISYADRSRVSDPAGASRVGPGKNGMVRPVILIGGRVAGTWSHAAAKRAEPEYFGALSARQEEAALAAQERFRAFVAPAEG